MLLTPPNSLAAALAERDEQGRPVRIGLIGCGEMGTDLLTQVRRMRGLEIAAVANLHAAAAEAAADIAEIGADQRRRVDSAAEMASAVEQRRLAITENASLIVEAEQIDVIIDATGRPAVGAEIGLAAMERGKHLVMMNVEADVTIGAYLKREADRLGVVYTLGAGDEPSSCMELIHFVSSLGYPVVAAGKGKNNPLNPDAAPTDYEDEARRRNMNPRMLVEFVDGSKTMVEMAAIANATGLAPDIPGMHGPSATLDQLEKVLCPEADGGVLSRKGVVDYTIGKGVAPGVFVVAEIAHPRLRERMSDLKLGPGPYYTFHRPYHLTSLEVPLSAARAALYGAADMAPLPRPTAEVCARAKRAIAAGERLGAIGETDYRAWTMTVADARAASAVPCGLLDGGRAISPIAKGALMTTENCAPDPDSRLTALRARQDALLAG